MNERVMRISLGLFVVLALVLLTTMIVLFHSLPRLFRSTIPYTIVFSEAPGVSQGTPVRRAGVRIGEVTNVRLDDNDGKVRVDIAVDRDHPVRQNEEATLVTSLIGGDATIDFVPKTLPPNEVADRSPMPAGSELVGAPQVTVNALLNRASSVVPATEKTMEDIRNSLKRLERMSPLIEETTREYRDLARDVRATIPDLRKSNDEVRELSKSLRDSVPTFRNSADDIAATARTYTKLGERLNVLLEANQDKIVKTLDLLNDNLQRLSALFSEENRHNFGTILKNVSTASNQFDEIARNAAYITRESKTTVGRLNDSLVRFDDVLNNVQKATKPFADRGESLTRQLDDVLTDVRKLFRAIDENDGTIQRLLKDPTLYNRLDEMLCMVQKSLRWLDPIMKDISIFADELARHPEQLGIRGAIRPSPGIK